MNRVNLLCPSCKSKEVIKAGKRIDKYKQIQRLMCKSCNKSFTASSSKHKTYPSKIILNAISYYNLGHSQSETSKILAQKFKLGVPQKTISNWLNEYKSICTFHKLRKETKKLCSPETIIEEYSLMHNNLPYKFQMHKAKLYLLFHSKLYNNQFHNISHFYEPLKQYLERIPTKNFPHRIFTYNKNNGKNNQSSPNAAIVNKNLASMENNKNLIDENKNSNETIKNSLNAGVGQNVNEKRASQIKFNHLKITTLSKNNLACKLVALALNLAATNKDRHQKIQDFFLINDSTTIATELPIYLTNWDAGYYKNQRGFTFPLSDYQTPITGHIDILQIRNGLIHILDYKPDAKNQNPVEQLTIYALALSRKLNLQLYYFKCAWFDENSYFEFFPLHAVYEKSTSKSLAMAK